MIECPKCGFTQPADKYCANCGVDIDHYHAKPTPLFQRISNNPLSYLVLLVVALIGLVVFISAQPDSQIARTAKEWVLDSDEIQEDSQEIETLEESDISQSERPTQETQNTSVRTKTTSLAQTESQKPNAEGDNAEATVALPKELRVQFLSFSRSKLDFIYGASQILAESSDLQVLILKKEEAIGFIKETDPETETLPGGKDFALTSNASQNFNFTYQDQNGEEYGFAFLLRVNGFNSENISLDYEILINLSEGPESPAHSNSIVGNYQFPPNAALVLSGIIPRQTLSEADSQELSSTPLQIMESEAFSSPDAQSPSEFLIVLEAI